MYADFRRFMKWKNDKSNHNIHRYVLHVQVVHISKMFNSHDEFAGIWCEISTEKGFVKSDLVEMHTF